MKAYLVLTFLAGLLIEKIYLRYSRPTWNKYEVEKFFEKLIYTIF